MVRRLFLCVVLFLLLLCPVAKADGDNGLTTWLMGDYNQTGVRVGYAWETFEVFLQSYWWLWEDVDPPQVYGLGVLYDFPGEIDIGALPILGGLKEHISLASYIGFQGAIELRDNADERGYYGPMVGVILNKFIFDEVDDQIQTGTEVRYVRYTDQLKEDLRTDEVQVSFFVRILF